MKILIIDDDPVVMEVVASIVKSHGCTPITAQDVQEGVRNLYSDESIEMIIMDWMMPNLNGCDACRLIKMSRPNIYIAIATGQKTYQKIIEMTGCGADMVIGKDELIRRIPEAIMQSRQGEVA